MQMLDRSGQKPLPAIPNARRNVDGVTAIPGTGTFRADTAPGMRSEGNNGAFGSSGPWTR